MTENLHKPRRYYSPARESISPSYEDRVDTDITARDYYNSNFPSLLTQLGPSADRRSKTRTRKKQNSGKATFSADSAKDHRHRKSEEKLSFAEEMRKRNEAQWMRIQAVAKEKLDRYEEYAMEMFVKVRRQREQINRRSKELLASLAKEEEKKREQRFYESSYGRIWRHHRTMQRRAFSLEPMVKKDKQIFTVTTPGSKISA